MKKVNYLFLAVLFSLSHDVSCQEFNFKITLEDAQGDKDTLIFGYDDLATDSVDILFNEINLSNSPVDSTFDVGFSNFMYTYNNITPRYYQKKQIAKKNSGCSTSIFAIEIKSKNWPVTAKWDSSLFGIDCRKGSFITSIPPGHWWDSDGGSTSNLFRVTLWNKNEITFTSNYTSLGFGDNCAYINPENDTISLFWIKIGPSCIQNQIPCGTPIESKTVDKLEIFPNPTEGILNVYGNDMILLKILSAAGIEENYTIIDDIINIEKLESGIYFLVFETLDKNLLVRKVLKY